MNFMYSKCIVGVPLVCLQEIDSSTLLLQLMIAVSHFLATLHHYWSMPVDTVSHRHACLQANDQYNWFSSGQQMVATTAKWQCTTLLPSAHSLTQG